MAKPASKSRDNKYARFLTMHATARWLAQSEGLDALADDPVPLLFALQNAHEQIVQRESRTMVLRLLDWIRAGKLREGVIQPKRLAELFDVSVKDLQELERFLERAKANAARQAGGNTNEPRRIVPKTHAAGAGRSSALPAKRR